MARVFSSTFVWVLLLMLISSAGMAQNNSWHRLSSQPSKALDGNVEALIYWDDGTGPALIAGGDFATAGWQPAVGIARWDGVAWTRLGEGLNGTVRALAVYKGELIATGDFTLSGTRVVNGIARWNGVEWLPLGTGLSAGGRALVAEGGALYVGGEFLDAGGELVNRIAKWNGLAWSTMGAGFKSDVRALHFFGNELYAGGFFGVSKWEGSTWGMLPTLGAVFALTTFNNELIAGGSFAIGINTSRVARWTGTAWAGLAGGLPGTEVRALRPYGNLLVAAGRFELGSNFGRNIAVWNGSTWGAIAAAPNDGVSGDAAAAIIVNAVTNNEQALVFGGAFQVAGSIGAASIAQWDQGWTGFATGISSSVESIGIHDGRLIATGTFTSIPGSANGLRVGAWDGSNWIALGGGIPGNSVHVVDQTTYQKELVVAGSFFAPGSSTSWGVTRWNGTEWLTLGRGTLGIRALTVSGPDLVVAGVFGTAGNVNANNWALWNGNDWRAMPAFGLGSDRYARTLGSSLYGSSQGQIARFENGAWVTLGGSFNAVNDLHLFNGEVYAAVNTVGAVRWTGSNWQSIGGLSDFDGMALATYNGALVLAGRQQGGNTTSKLLVSELNGNTWNLLGEVRRAKPFTLPEVTDLEVYGGRLIVAGEFSEVVKPVLVPGAPEEASERAVNLVAFGPRIPTTVEIISATPSSPVLGQAVEITVRVQSADGAPRGLVSVVGSPRGVCSVEAFEFVGNTSTGRCVISFFSPGQVQLRAQFSGGTVGARSWQASNSALALPTFPGELIFRDGFESIVANSMLN